MHSALQIGIEKEETEPRKKHKLFTHVHVYSSVHVPSKERVAEVLDWLCVCLCRTSSQQARGVGLCVLFIQVELLHATEERERGGEREGRRERRRGG